MEHPSPDVAYSLLEYVAFLAYPPLYIAGPTSSFNAFASQLHTPQRTYTHAAIARYALVKFALIFAATEVFTHTVYANAMAVSREWSPGAGGFGPDDVGVTSLMTLNFMWFKFAVIWRFFRLWALMSGVEVPENMVRKGERGKGGRGKGEGGVSPRVKDTFVHLPAPTLCFILNECI